MAVYSRPEFAKLCGVSVESLRVYISRKKVVELAEGGIDGNDLKNIAFQQKHSSRSGNKEAPPPPPLFKPPAVVPTPEPQKPPLKPPVQKLVDESYAFLEKEKLRMQVEELKKKTRKMDQMHEKAQGESVPTAQVTMLILQLSEAIHGAWETAFEETLNEIAHKHQLTRLEITELKRAKVKISNSSREKAIKEAIKMLRRVQAEFAESKGVGEHG